MGLHVVVVGNLGDGFEIIGPFNNGEEAIEWGEHSKSLRNTDWCVMTLDSPESVEQEEEEDAEDIF